MKNGIFTDAATGKAYFTGYQYKTLYDWDQYFEAIVKLYLGWEPKYIANETGDGCGLNPFWGWTLLGYFFEFELTHDADPTPVKCIASISKQIAKAFDLQV